MTASSGSANAPSTSGGEGHHQLVISCGVSTTGQLIAESLAGVSFHHDPQSSIKLLLDVPRGYALQTLQSLERTALKIIVITWNPCAEHLEDLWDLGHDALLAGDALPPSSLREAVSDITQHIARGKRYRFTPGEKTSLTGAERAVLRYAAQGLDNKGIADRLMIREQAAKNTLQRAYNKLNIHSHVQAALYYWQVWQPPE